MCLSLSSSQLKRLQKDLEDVKAEASSLQLRLHDSEEARSADRDQLQQTVILQEGWELEKSDLEEKEAESLRQVQETIQLREQAVQRCLQGELTEQNLRMQLAAAQEAAPLLELSASACMLRQGEEVSAEAAFAKRFRREAEAWKNELGAAANHHERQVRDFREQQNTLSDELDAEIQTVREVREELWAEQAKIIARDRHVDQLKLELEKASQEQTSAKQRLKDFETLAQSEISVFLAERNQAIRDRDAALLARDEATCGWNEALEMRDRMQMQRDEALRVQVAAQIEANRKLTSLRVLSDDVQMQLRVEREQVRCLHEEVGLCARSSAARAAASYLGCIQQVRPTWPGLGSL